MRMDVQLNVYLCARVKLHRLVQLRDLSTDICYDLNQESWSVWNLLSINQICVYSTSLVRLTRHMNVYNKGRVGVRCGKVQLGLQEK